MASLIYAMCALVALGAGLLLLRSFADTGSRLLLWSGVCFLGLTVNNALVFVDIVIVPDMDLYLYRQLAGLGGVAALLYGLVWETR